MCGPAAFAKALSLDGGPRLSAQDVQRAVTGRPDPEAWTAAHFVKAARHFDVVMLVTRPGHYQTHM